MEIIQQQYNVDFANFPVIQTTVTANNAMAEQWARHNAANWPAIVGLELKSKHDAGVIVILQLCIGNQCLIYQLYRATQPPPPSLRACVANPNVLFVGRAGIRDRVNLLGSFGLEFSKVSGVDELLGQQPRYVQEFPIFNDFKYMVAALLDDAELVLLPLDGWETEILSSEHVKAAAQEVFTLKEVAMKICNNE